jgi:hypothetical protein
MRVGTVWLPASFSICGGATGIVGGAAVGYAGIGATGMATGGGPAKDEVQPAPGCPAHHWPQPPKRHGRHQKVCQQWPQQPLKNGSTSRAASVRERRIGVASFLAFADPAPRVAKEV